MSQAKHLYLVTTAGLGDFHVIASDPTTAQNSVEQILNKEQYGYTKDRKVTNIEWITEYISQEEDGSYFLSDKKQAAGNSRMKNMTKEDRQLEKAAYEMVMRVPLLTAHPYKLGDWVSRFGKRFPLEQFKAKHFQHRIK